MPREKSNFSDEYAIFLAALRRSREDSGRTQTDVAAFLKRDQSVVSKCERGERRIDVIELRDYCRAIGIELRTFVDILEKEITQATTAKASLRAKKRASR
jgi:ribosome-binding protein aMBF1 (putative translation factor)